MTKIIKKFQRDVNRFSNEIRTNLNLDLERIRVKDIKESLLERFLNIIGVKFPWMSTIKGKIFVNQPLVEGYSDQKNERALLHELGHRTAESINPYLMSQAGLKEAGYKGGTRGLIWLILANPSEDRFRYISEGAAEFLSLEIFPQFCSISEKGKKEINIFKKSELYLTQAITLNKNQNREVIARLTKLNMGPEYTFGFNYFREIHEVVGLEGVKKYIKNIQHYQMPSLDDLVMPEAFIKHYLKSRLV